MQVPLKVRLSFSSLHGGTKAARILVYDPESSYTWVPRSLLNELSGAKARRAKCFRKVCIRVPGSARLLEAETIVLCIHHNAMMAADEVILTEDESLVRLGWRTLVALNGYIEETETPGMGSLASGDAKYTRRRKEAREVALAPKKAVTPYSDLYRKARTLGLPSGGDLDELRVPAKRNSLSRAALVLRTMTARLLNDGQITCERIAKELNFVLVRLLGFRSVITLVSTRGDHAWKPSVGSQPFSGTLPAPEESVQLGRSMCIGHHICAFFPSVTAAQTTEARIGCLVRPANSEEKYLWNRLVPVLRPILDVLLVHAESNDILIGSRRHAKLLLGYPRSREKDVSFDILTDAKKACSNWTYVALWRTSRKDKALEKIAEDFPKKPYAMQFEAVKWPAIRIPPQRAGVPAKSETINYHAVIWPGAQHLDFGESEKLRAEATDIELFISDRRTAKVRGRLEALETNIRILADRIPCPPGGVILLFGAYSHNATPEIKQSKRVVEALLPNQFHLVLATAMPAADLASVSRGAIANLRRMLELRLLQYSVLSWSRFQLRCIGDFLTKVYEADNETSLIRELSYTLEIQMGTPHFILINRLTGHCTLRSSSLDEWRLPLTVPNLRDGSLDVKSLSDLGGNYKAVSKLLMKTVPERFADSARSENVAIDVGGIFSHVSDTLVLLVLRCGWGGWNVSSPEYSAARALGAALRLARPVSQSDVRSISSPVPWSDRHHALLNNKCMDLSDALDNLIGAMFDELRGEAELFAEAAATMFAVCGEADFVRVIAERNPALSPQGVTQEQPSKRGLVSENRRSMVTVALEHYKKTTEFSPLFGIVRHGDSAERSNSNCEVNAVKRVELTDRSLSPSTDYVPFLGLLNAAHGDVLLVQGFARVDRQPLGFLAVRLGTVDNLSQKNIVAALRIVRHFSEQAALILQRQAEFRTVDIRTSLAGPLSELQNLASIPITEFSELRRELTECKTQFAQHLPPPLLRAFTPKFCRMLSKTIATISWGIQAFSINVRVVFPAKNGRDHSWTLAATGDSIPEPHVQVDPHARIECFACQNASGLGRGHFFIPDYSQLGALSEVHPGVPKNIRAPNGVRSELFVSFPYRHDKHGHFTRDESGEPHRLVIGIRSSSFFELWLLEKTMDELCSSLASEILLHYRHVEDIERQALDFASSTIRSIRHTLSRDVFFAAGVERDK